MSGHDVRREMDWYRIGVWIVMLSFVAMAWTGIYQLVASALR
jgi:hypothetical protein